MIGETAFSIGIWPDAPRGAALLSGWERFGLPLAEAAAAGGGTLPRVGSLLSLNLGAAQLSNVRRHDDRSEVRIWNPGREPVTARVGDTTRQLGAAEIATFET